MITPTFQYQEDGARVLASRERFGLHDEMGVGKTAQVIRAVNMMGARRGIVVCPATLRENWIMEFRKFSHVAYRVAKGRDIHDLQAWLRGRFHILVVGYEMAVRWTPRIIEQGEPIDFIALDEAHFLKNPASQRTRMILGKNHDGFDGALLNWAGAAWDVTGTRMANDPSDIYTFLKMTWATDLTEPQFHNRYFDVRRTAYGIRTSVKPEMLDELQHIIYSVSIRRTKTDVGIFLPPVFMTDMTIDGDTSAIREMLLEHPGLERAIEDALRQEGAPWLSFLDQQHISTLRKLIASAKAVPYSRILMEELAGTTEKRVVYGIHVDALATLYNELNNHGFKTVLINGTVNERDRIEAVRAFQEDADCRVFLGNIRSAGTGLTLTAACEIDMFECDWTPAGNAQAIMRIHRIGQTRAVRARFIQLANSIDEIVTRIVAVKTAAIAQVDGHEMLAAPPLASH